MANALVTLAAGDVGRLLVAVILLVTTAVLLVLGKPVPDALWAMVGAVVSFFFAVGVVKSAR